MNSAEEMFKKKFIKWAKDKSLDEIADKAYQAMSYAYDECRQMMTAKAFEIFVKRPFEERKAPRTEEKK